MGEVVRKGSIKKVGVASWYSGSTHKFYIVVGYNLFSSKSKPTHP